MHVNTGSLHRFASHQHGGVSGVVGGLVKKILGTKKELESQPAKKTEIVCTVTMLI